MTMNIIIRSVLLLFLLIPASWLEIGKRNAAIKAASKSYAEASYEASVANHLKLATDFDINTPYLSYNLALSYHYNGQLEEAQRAYLGLIASGNKILASFASNQNGTILASQEKYEDALAAFKYALIQNPENEPARYNYELLTRWLQQNPEQKDKQEDEQEKNDQQENEDQKSEQENKENQEKKDGEGDEQTKEDEASESQKKEDKTGEKEEKESDEASDMESDLSDRQKAREKMKQMLQEMNLTPEQAAQILEAMNAAELRYIQQNKKKPSQRPNRGLPEW
jgi:hypothetical protein